MCDVTCDWRFLWHIVAWFIVVQLHHLCCKQQGLVPLLLAPAVPLRSLAILVEVRFFIGLALDNPSLLSNIRFVNLMLAP